jgi:hypothetical protein
VRRGFLPNDSTWLGSLVRDLSFRNARAYFQFPLPDAFLEAERSVARPG